MSNDKFRITPQNWDNFIKDFDGLDCRTMCDMNRPKSSTVRLLQNPHSSNVWCNWCSKVNKGDNVPPLNPLRSMRLFVD